MFLQFVWKHALFTNREGLNSASEHVIIQRVGEQNHNAGPDFNNAWIIIDGTLWVGNVEVHIRSSDWYRHGHDKDPAYENVILQVVYRHDNEIITAGGRKVPSYEIAFAPEIYEQYYALMNNRQWIPCAGFIQKLDPLAMEIWFQELINERMENRSREILFALKQHQGDWEQAFYQKLLRSLGNPVNAEPFERLGKCLPLKYLQRHHTQLQQLEALLFGQAGFLKESSTDPYMAGLWKEYTFLAAKYGLKPLPQDTWHFLRLRPAHFPTVRIAQMAGIIHRYPTLFRYMLEADSCHEIKKIFQIPVSQYWLSHYRFGKETPLKNKTPGSALISSVTNNVIIPFRYAYALHIDDPEGKHQALDLLEKQPPEDNRITRNWASLGLSNNSASRSQALIHLKKQYCTFKKCLQCQIGRMIITG